MAELQKRQTYIGRTSPGKYGKFKESEKILFRYDNRADHSTNNRDVIQHFWETSKKIASEIGQVKLQVLKEAVPVYLEALKKYTPVDTGQLRDSWKVELRGTDLYWINDAGGVGNEYVYAQNYGKDGITPTGGVYFYPGYYFLEKARNETLEFIRKRQQELFTKVKSNNIGDGFK